jgi:hypothetical protein
MCVFALTSRASISSLGDVGVLRAAVRPHKLRQAKENCGTMIWGDVDRDRRLTALLVALVFVVGVVAVSFGAAAALG